MLIVLNGPLGIGKSTLAEALAERIAGSVLLDGDHLVALNPPPADETGCLHEVIALLVRHHRDAGYRYFVVDHLWPTAADLGRLRERMRALDAALQVRCFLLELPLALNLQRIAGRQAARAIDERDFELRTVSEERGRLAAAAPGSLGEPFDVSAPPALLVERMLARLGLP